jgi:hypothetical protein
MDAGNGTIDDADRMRRNAARSGGVQDGAAHSSGVQGAIPGINMRTRATKPRSKITSGRALFVDGDPNSAWARRYADLLAGHVSDAGGMELMTDAKFSLIRRISTLECELERLEARFSRNEPTDLDAYARAASHLRRMLETLGLDRKQRDVTPTLDSYLAGKYVNED